MNSKLAEKARFININLVTFLFQLGNNSAIQTCHLPAHTLRGPVGSVLPQVHLAALREVEWRTVVHLEHSDHLA